MAFDAHGAFESSPPERHRGERVRSQVLSLAGLIVRKPGEASFIEVFEKHKSVGGSSVCADCSQGTCIRLHHAHLTSEVEGEVTVLLADAGQVNGRVSTFISVSCGC